MWSIIGWPGSGVGPSSQPSNRPPSSEHSNSAGSLAENTNAADVLVVEVGGPETISVSGTLPLTSQLHSSGVVSTTPYGVTERTSRMFSPSVRPLRLYGFEHGANGPRFSAHS